MCAEGCEDDNFTHFFRCIKLYIYSPEKIVKYVYPITYDLKLCRYLLHSQTNEFKWG